MTHWLAIDTAMNACGVGVRRADGKIFEKTEHMDRGQSERLMPMILEVVADAGISLADIGAYAVTIGPGTFTGLRVGLATVRALSQVSGKPAIGVSTFDALAAAVERRPTLILIETKRSDYYARLFEKDAVHEGACLSADDLRDMVEPEWILAGDAVERAKAEAALSNEAVHLASPKTSDIVAIAEGVLGQGAQVSFPEPLYLRGADTSISKRRVARIV